MNSANTASANELASSAPLVPPPRTSSRDPSPSGDHSQPPAVSDETTTAQSGQNQGPSNEHSEKVESEAKRSLTGRRRDASRGSRRSAQIRTSASDNRPRSAGAGAMQMKPKKKGFLSFLTCCATPESDELDSPDSAQPTKSSVNRSQPTRSRVPQQGQQPQNASATNTSADSQDVLDEKNGSTYEAANRNTGAEPSEAPIDTARSTTQHAQMSEREAPVSHPLLDTAGIAPLVNVQAPTPTVAASDEEQLISDRTPQQQAIDTDIEMTDAGPSLPLSTAEVPPVPEDEGHEIQPRKSTDSTHRIDLPPPPPLAERQAQTTTAAAAAAAAAAGATTASGHQDPNVSFSSEPSRRWLLPSISAELKDRKCLVLDLDETLVHSSFKILHQADFTIPVEIEGQYHNVYVIKRPGVDTFLKRVGELYEVVVFTASVSKYGDPLLDQLDISGSVHHRLFRESCYNHQGNYVKDLSQVGRPLEETIIIDNSPTSYIFHPQHAVPISSWFSDAHDNELLDLIPVLEDLAGPQVRDVSLVLDVAL